ncbi:ATP-binding cassette domain-containing protein [Pendulispora albinea]|uniref:ABC transporter ATP-binding protein n=1 Tax=Pendulispora albinea TaxID=2741071 RepID=A0ABZ2M0X2_9BACT
MTHAIDVEGLERHFGAFKAVRGVSFHVEQGEIFGYLGANGAGKSTTIRILCGLLPPSGGKATVAGHDVGTDSEGVRLSVGYMSQKFSLYPDLTAFENLDFFGGAYRLQRAPRRRRARELMIEVGLDPDDRALTAAMPGGMRQRVALAAALLHEPRIVFLDEPTAGVDPVARRVFWRTIRRVADAGVTIFVTTHYMDEAEYCNRVGLMVDGALVALDTPSRLKETYVPGVTYEVRGERITPKWLRHLPGVTRIEPFGTGLHVGGDDTLCKEAIENELGKVGARGVSVESIQPTLEDVFLAVVTRKAPA